MSSFFLKKFKKIFCRRKNFVFSVFLSLSPRRILCAERLHFHSDFVPADKERYQTALIYKI